MNKKITIGAIAILLTSIALGFYDLTYAFGLSAAILVILLTTKAEKELHDMGKQKQRWKEFFKKNWDDFLLTWFGAIALIALQHYIIDLVLAYYKLDYHVLYHEAGQFVIAAALGWLSDGIVKKLYSRRKDVVNKLSKKL